MATDLLKLRQQAKRKGMVGTRGAGRAELEAFLSDNSGGTTKPRKKRPTSAPAKKRPSAQAKRRNTGRTRKTTTPPKQTRTRTTRTAKPKAKATGGNGGRNPIDTSDLDFSAEGFNPRAGGDREMIFKAIKKARGNRDRAFTALLPEISRLVPSKKKDGSRRTKAEKESYLRYLINRVLFDFAIATDQHASSKNRAVYGEGGTGQGIFKRGKTKPAPRKPATRGRKPAGRKPAKPAARRGRPPGSKNKPRTTARSRKGRTRS